VVGAGAGATRGAIAGPGAGASRGAGAGANPAHKTVASKRDTTAVAHIVVMIDDYRSWHMAKETAEKKGLHAAFSLFPFIAILRKNSHKRPLL
jgi:hypothetical protein